MTRLSAYVGEAFAAIWRNRARSILTLLGMIIGTSSIIAVLGIGKAASGGIIGTLDSFGDLGISVGVDPNQDDVNAATIQYRDVRTIEAQVGPLLEHIEPAYIRSLRLRANGNTIDTFVVSGSDFHKDSQAMAEGRRLDAPTSTTARACACSPSRSRSASSRARPPSGRRSRWAARAARSSACTPNSKAGCSTPGGNEYLEIPVHHVPRDRARSDRRAQVYAAPGVSVGDVATAIVDVLQQLHGPRSKYLTQDNTAQVRRFNTCSASSPSA